MDAQFVKYFIDSRVEIDRLKQGQKDLKLRQDDLDTRHEQSEKDLKLRQDNLDTRHKQFEKDLKLRQDDIGTRHEEFKRNLELRREKFEKEFKEHQEDSKVRHQEFEETLKARYKELEVHHEEFIKKIEQRQKELASSHKELDERQKRAEKWVYGLLIGAVLVLMFMAVTMLLDMWQFKSVHYKENHASFGNPQKCCKNNPDLNNIQSAIKDLKEEVKETNELNSRLSLIKAVNDMSNSQKMLADTVRHLEKELKQLYNNEKLVLNLYDEQKTTNCLVQKLEKEVNELRSSIETERVARNIVNEQLLKDSSQDTAIKKELKKLSQAIKKLQN